MRWQDTEQTAAIPMRLIGPIKIHGPDVQDDVCVPLATYESPLWPSTHRGAKACNQAGGIHAVVIDERMTRSILLEAKNAAEAYQLVAVLPTYRDAFENLAKETSRFAQFVDSHTQVVGNLIYIRLEFKTGDASGHNMASLAAEKILDWLLNKFQNLQYISISGNYCTDKKVSAVNGILGRGKYVVAEALLSREVCRRHLKTTPEKIVELNIKKNLLGNIVAGGLRAANAHFANMLLGFYLATGQDAANIIEGSQGIVHAECREGSLYFSVTLPNLIVGTVGNGKTLPFVQENLKLLGCLEKREVGQNARRLAVVAACAVLCGELSLLATQTIPGELMRSHLKLERHRTSEEKNSV